MRFYLIFLLFLSLEIFADEIGDLRRLYKDALVNLGNGNLNVAESNFILITKKSDQEKKAFKPYISKAYYFLGDIYFIKEDFKKAITFYRIVLTKYRDEEIASFALYKLGRTLVISDKLEEGIGVLQEFIINFPEEKDLISASYYWLGRAFLKKGDREKAIASYKKILEEYPESYFAYEVRVKLDALFGIQQNQKDISNIPVVTNKNILMHKEKLQKEKELLKKILTLLEIKQKLLELKMEYIDKMAKEKEENLNERNER